MSQIAKTIYQQLGGAKFAAMTGAKNFACDTQSLSFKFPRQNAINYCKITLNSMDTYDIEYGYVHGLGYKVKKESAGLYNDMLANDFKNVTGLDTVMPTIHVMRRRS
jgi:hypothetical protein